MVKHSLLNNLFFFLSTSKIDRDRYVAKLQSDLAWRSIAREKYSSHLCPALCVHDNLQLIPIHLRFATTSSSTLLARFHACTCEVHLRGGNASQGSLNNCNLRYGMRDVASSRKQVSRPFPRSDPSSALYMRVGCMWGHVRRFDAISRMPENGDAAVRCATYSVHSAPVQRISTPFNSWNC